MSRKSYVRGSTPIACYRNPDLNGKKIRVCGYAPLLDDLGPPHLLIPEGHTGTLTGLIEFVSFAQELPSDAYVAPIECMVLVEVAWDDLDYWHDEFCKHGRKTYRYSCLIDVFMGNYKVPPNFLFFIDSEGNNMHCVERHLQKYVNMTAITPNPLAQGSPYHVSIR